MNTLKDRERPMTLNGMKATLHPWFHSSDEIVVDHRINLSKIGNAINELNENSKPKIIGIEGSAGTGKSILAKLLNANAKNCQLIDVCSLMDYSSSSFELPSLNKTASTFIIDEAGFVQTKSLSKLIEKTIDKNSVLVLLFQTLTDFDVTVKNSLKDMTFFKLTRDGLTLVETL